MDALALRGLPPPGMPEREGCGERAGGQLHCDPILELGFHRHSAGSGSSEGSGASLTEIASVMLPDGGLGRDLGSCRILTCVLCPLRSTVTVTWAALLMDWRISIPRAGSSSGVPLIAVTRLAGHQAELRELLPVAPRVHAVAALLPVG